MGIERTLERIARARIVIRLLDAATFTGTVPPPDFNLPEGCTLLTVLNKTDLRPELVIPHDVIGLSARNGDGLDALRQALLQAVGGVRYASNSSSCPSDAPCTSHLSDTPRTSRHSDGFGAPGPFDGFHQDEIIVSNSRHFEALSDAHNALARALSALREGLPSDLLSEDIRQVIHHIGAITGRGVILSDEILGNIFSKFCIGK